MTVERLDRRAALKARHRSAIVAAARTLIDERGADGFSTDDLAERADVARRTVFNHFSSLEDVVVACLDAELAAAITSVESGVRTAVRRTGPLDDLEASLRAADLPTAIASIDRMLAMFPGTATSERVRQESLRHIAGGMVEQLGERYPDLPHLEVVLLTTTVMNGVGVIAEAWVRQTSAGPDAAGRRLWVEHLDHLFTTLRRGFAAHPVGAATGPTTTEGA